MSEDTLDESKTPRKSSFTTANFFVGGTAPAPAQAGDMWYNTSTGSTLQFTGSGWNGTQPVYVTDVQNQLAASSYAVSHPIWVAPNTGETWQVKSVSGIWGTASASGTLQVMVTAATVAIGSGTNQLTGTISTAATALTAVNGTVIAAPTAIVAGSRVELIFGGSATGLLNAVFTVALVKLT